jgi:2,3-dihydroxyphenylpropionate 1,2-dioxygenase
MTSNRAARAYVCVSHSPLMSLSGAEEHGTVYRSAIEEVRAFIADFAPDLVVLFAPDHMNLLNAVRPPFTTVLSGCTLPEFSIPEFPLNVHLDSATDMCRHLLERGVDMAVAEEVAVDHGMGLTLTQLFDEPAAVPLVPVVVNAIGFPLIPLYRADTLGGHVQAALADRSERILFIGTGGLSHNPPFPEPAPGAKRLGPEERAQSLSRALDYMDPEWDQELLSRIASGDAEWFAQLTQTDLDRRGGGANEVRTWMAAWAACGHAPALRTSYEAVDAWITGMGVAFGVQR